MEPEINRDGARNCWNRTKPKGELTIVEEPIEIRSVVLAFNKLLKEQRETIAREKRFVADASHELRTPLAAIRGHVQLIQRRGTKHPEVIPSSLAFIDKESKRLETLSINCWIWKTKTQRNKPRWCLADRARRMWKNKATIVPQSIEYFVENQCRKQGHKRDFQQIIQNLFRKMQRSIHQQISPFMWDWHKIKRTCL